MGRLLGCNATLFLQEMESLATSLLKGVEFARNHAKAIFPPLRNKNGEVTYRANSFCHFRHDHDDGEAPATEGCDGEFVVYVAELCLCVEDAHVEELGEDLALHAGAEWVLGREEGEAVG